MPHGGSARSLPRHHVRQHNLRERQEVEAQDRLDPLSCVAAQRQWRRRLNSCCGVRARSGSSIMRFHRKGLAKDFAARGLRRPQQGGHAHAQNRRQRDVGGVSTARRQRAFVIAPHRQTDCTGHTERARHAQRCSRVRSRSDAKHTMSVWGGVGSCAPVRSEPSGLLHRAHDWHGAPPAAAGEAARRKRCTRSSWLP
jgi:hypothetical protein